MGFKRTLSKNKLVAGLRLCQRLMMARHSNESDKLFGNMLLHAFWW
jgi:hypothetical protein